MKSLRHSNIRFIFALAIHFVLLILLPFVHVGKQVYGQDQDSYIQDAVSTDASGNQPLFGGSTQNTPTTNNGFILDGLPDSGWGDVTLRLPDGTVVGTAKGCINECMKTNMMEIIGTNPADGTPIYSCQSAYALCANGCGSKKDCGTPGLSNEFACANAGCAPQFTSCCEVCTGARGEETCETVCDANRCPTIFNGCGDPYGGPPCNYDCYRWNNDPTGCTLNNCTYLGSNFRDKCSNTLTTTCGVGSCGTCNNPCGNSISCTPPATCSQIKTCSISVPNNGVVTAGTPITVSYSGNNNNNTDPSDNVNLWLEQWNGGNAIAGFTPSWTDPVTGHKYFRLTSCSSSGNTECTGSYDLTLPAGTYYAHCDLQGSPGKCSGDPFCPYEGLGGTDDCTGWQSCSSSDNHIITVNPPPVTINSRAVVVGNNADCAAIRASTNGINGAVHGFTVAPAPTPTPLTQAGDSYVTFASSPPSASTPYTLSISNIPADYVPQKACWQTSTPTNSGEGLSVSLNGGETLTWDVGYSAGSAWAQTQGGNVYAQGTITSYIPSLATPRTFSLDGSGGYPGLVTYGNTYDFSAVSGSQGESYVSRLNWLVNQVNPTTNYFDLFYHRLGAPTTESDLTKNDLTKPRGGALETPAVYYLKGPVNTRISDSWTIPSGESIVIIVDDSAPGARDGTLTINSPITVNPGGFLAFIVRGNIVISPDVGTLYSSDTSVLDGIYVTGILGTIHTGASSSANKEHFVGKGMFIANSFALERDLDSIARNTTTASELFIYDPELLFTMPDSLKDVPVTWQEVAP